MTERDDLPLPDHDHLPVGSLISRFRTLDADASGGSAVSGARTGPPVKPPSHGDPTNPAQPR